MTLLFRCLIVMAVLASSMCDANPIVETIVPKRGSIYGETRVSVLGSGFDIRGRSNDIFIGEGTDGVFCDPIPNECHDKRIVCLMPATEMRGTKPLTVRSFGAVAKCSVSGGCTYEFTPSRTPVVSRIIPEWITTPATVEVRGSRFTNGDVSVGRFDFTMHIADEERCQQLDDATSSSFLCGVEPMYAGTHKLKVVLGDSGQAGWSQATKLVIYPRINSITPNKGSRGGGQLITVFGSGFDRDPVNNRISIHGIACVVVQYLDEGVVCRTGAATVDTPNGKPVPGIFKSGTLRRDMWLKLPGTSIYEDLVALNAFHTPTHMEIVDGVHYAANQCEYCAVRFTGYFVANETGDHTFWIRGDDQVALWLSDSENPKEFRKTGFLTTDPFNKFQVAFCSSATSSFDSFDTQKSRLIRMEKGKHYWMAIYMKENTGGDNVDVRLDLPSGKRTPLYSSFLAYREDYTPVITAEVAGLKSRYDEGCLAPDGGACHFQYDEKLTPMITAVSPNTDVIPGAAITISGSRLPTTCSLVEVFIGPHSCAVTSCSATQVVCTVDENVPFGSHAVKLAVVDIGNALGTIVLKTKMRVLSTTPKQGGVAGGTSVTIQGSGFNPLPGKTGVTVGGKPCNITYISGTFIVCTTPKGIESTNSDIEVTAIEDTTAQSTDAFSFDGEHTRPGTTTEIAKDSVNPGTGTMNGGTTVTIFGKRLARAYAASDIEILLGSSPCTMHSSVVNMVTCVSGQSSVSGLVDVIIRTKVQPAETIFTLTRAFEYVPTPMNIVPLQGGRIKVSPFGGVTLTIRGVSIKDPNTVKVRFANADVSTEVDYNMIEAVLPTEAEAKKTFKTSPIETYFSASSKTNPLSTFSYSDDAKAKLSANSKSIDLPNGNNWISTKRKLSRPLRIMASVTPLETMSCSDKNNQRRLSVRLLTNENGDMWQGYTIAIDPGTRRVWYGINGWVRLANAPSSMPSLSNNARNTWRVDIINDFVELYIDNNLVIRIEDHGITTGSVGFGYGCQDMRIENFVLEDLSDSVLSVSIDGVPMKAINQDVLYVAGSAPNIVSLSQSSVKMGDVITIMGTSLTKSTNVNENRVLLSTSATSTDVTATSPTLCSSVPRFIDLSSIGQGQGITCTIALLPAGTFRLRVATAYGLSDPSTAATITVTPHVSESSPATSGSEGTNIMIKGSALPISKNDVKVTIGTSSAVCVVEVATINLISCRSPKLANGTYDVKVSVKGQALTCSDCTIKYDDTITPVVTSMSITSGVEGDIVEFRGTKLSRSYLHITIGDAGLCTYYWGDDSKRLRCRVPSGPIGKHVVSVRNSNGFAKMESELTFEYKRNVARLSPAAGSVHGGTQLTIVGNAFTESWHSSSQLQWDFTTGNLQSGWTGVSGLPMTFCPTFGGMLGGYNAFGVDAKVSRTFSMPAHKRVRVQLSLLALDSWDSGEEFVIYIDGKQFMNVARGTVCSKNDCGANYNDCLTDFDFNLPHTASTFKLGITASIDQGAHDESWGLLKYTVSYNNDDAPAYTVKVGGQVCETTYASDTKLVCTTPASKNETTSTTVPVEVVQRSGSTVVPCDSADACSYTYNTDKSPVILSLSPEISVADSKLLTFKADTNVVVSADKQSVQVTKVKSSASWDTAVTSTELFHDVSDFDGIEFYAPRTGQAVMTGLTTVSSTTTYSSIEFAFYMSGTAVYIYERGRNTGHVGYYGMFTRFTIRPDRNTNKVHFFLDNQLVHISNRDLEWPLYVAVALHTSYGSVSGLRVLTRDDSHVHLYSLSGANFGAMTDKVKLDGNVCRVWQAADGLLSCSMSNKTISSTTPTTVSLIGKNGLAQRKVTLSPSIVGITTPTSVSSTGYQAITISGKGLASNLTITAGATKMILVSISRDSVVAMAPAMTAGVADIKVTDHTGAPVVCGFGTGLCQVNFSAPISVNTIPEALMLSVTADQVVSMAGTFASLHTPVLYIMQDLAVKAEVAPSAFTKDTVSFRAPDLEGGKYNVVVAFADAGAAVGSYKLHYTLNNVKATPSTTCSNGDAVITFTGSGFGKSGDVSIESSANVPFCKSVTRTAGGSTVLCVTKAMSWDGSVTVKAGDVSASVSIRLSPNMCPTVSSIAPSSGSTGDIVTITGTNLHGASHTVTVGTANAKVVSSSETSLVVQLTSGAPAGPTKDIFVRNDLHGASAAKSTSAEFTFVMNVESVSPSYGAKKGGTTVTITGTGFGTKADEVTVQFGDSANCAIKEVKDDRIVCTTSSAADTGTPSTVRVMLHAANSPSVKAVSPTKFEYLPKMTPVLKSFTPTFGSAGGGTHVTITGQNFIADPRKNKVVIGGSTCTVDTASASEITCVTTSHNVSTGAEVIVYVDDQGATRNDAGTTFTYELSISKVTPTLGSVQGGQLLTLTGKGFGHFMASNYTHVYVDSMPCKLVSASYTMAICQVPPSRRIFRSVTADRSQQNSFLVSSHTMRPDGKVGVHVIVNGTSSSVCNQCYEYAAASTPTVTSMNPLGANVILTRGASLTLKGTNFGANPTVHINDKDMCEVQSASDTEVKCKLTTTNVGNFRAVVKNAALGDSHTLVQCPAGQYLTCDGSCIQDDDCVFAEWGVSTCKDLYRLIESDTFCHSNGGSDRLSKPFLSDKGTTLNFNCPMYNCEGQDCNTAITIGGRGAIVSTCGQDPNGFLVDYRPAITDVSPRFSSLAGGQNVTITGTNLGTLTSTVVAIGSAHCIVIEAAMDRIVCRTGAVTAEVTTELRLAVGRVFAECSVCKSFAYKADKTPVVDKIDGLESFDTRYKYGRARRGMTLTITGSNFPANKNLIRVLIGDKQLCSVTSATTTTVECTFPAMSEGRYSIQVSATNYGDATYSSTFTTSYSSSPIRCYLEVAKVTLPDGTATPRGSVMGGTTLIITAYGHDANTKVMWNDIVWDVLSFNDESITARTTKGQLGNRDVELSSGSSKSGSCADKTACKFLYHDPSTPTIESVSPSSLAFGAAETTITITAKTLGAEATAMNVSIGSQFPSCTITAGKEQSTLVCVVKHDIEAGTYPVQLNVAPYGYAQASTSLLKYPTYTFPLSVTKIQPVAGSLGGGQSVTLTGSGFGTSSTVSLGDTACAVSSATTNTLICVTGKPTAAGKASVTVVVKEPLATEAAKITTDATISYEYSASLTPTITSVTPNRGTTAGGGELTITGTNLKQNGQNIDIDGVNCTQSDYQKQRTTDTLLFCTTGAHPKTQKCSVRIRSPNGLAVQRDAGYEYVDLWSRWTTWGNTPPPAVGDSAVIQEGQIVVLDYTPPRYHLIIVMGELRADEGIDIHFQCTYIMINYGRFTVGTRDKPFTKNMRITLYGDRLTPEIPVHGAKVLALRHGALDMHGIPRQPTWTRLSKTSKVGSLSLQLRQPVDWKSGEWIVVTSTDFNMEHAEERQITKVINGQSQTPIVEFAKPLIYEHFGEKQCFGTNNEACVDESAAVGLLTRNVVVEGDATSMRNGFGGTLFLMPLGETEDRYARLSYVEFRDVGQQYIVGRYPVHYHVTHSSSTSFVNGTSVHRSLNRAFSIHGISNNTYVNNVAYDVQGHGFFIEDGSERWNVIKDNLMLVVRPSTSNLNTDLTPACFWIVSPSNWIEGNHAGGAGSYGYWIAPFHPHSTGPTYSPDICPATHKLWKFERNTAHSNGKYGVNIFRFWYPKEQECNEKSADAPATLRHVTVFKNRIH
eukprot:PhM_4_TR16797/c0_g1_i1/m.50591